MSYAKFDKPVLVQQERNRHLIPEWLDILHSHDIQQVKRMTVVMQQQKCATPKDNHQVRPA